MQLVLSATHKMSQNDHEMQKFSSLSALKCDTLLLRKKSHINFPHRNG